jgi:hypothetical protein
MVCLTVASPSDLSRVDFSGCLELTNNTWDTFLTISPKFCQIYMPLTNLSQKPGPPERCSPSQIKGNFILDDVSGVRTVYSNTHLKHILIMPSDGVDFSLIDAFKSGSFSSPRKLSSVANNFLPTVRNFLCHPLQSTLWSEICRFKKNNCKVNLRSCLGSH